MLETENEVVFNVLTDKKNEKYFKENFDGIYPYFRLQNFKTMTKELGINFLILSNDSLSKNNSDWNLAKEWKVSFKNDFLTTYELIYPK